MTTARDLVHIYAEHTAGLSYDSLPEAARDAARKSIIDTIGVILAASGSEPAVRGLIEIVQEAGGAPEASVLAFGGKAPAMMAALANGALAHCLDYDDQTPWGQHCASSIVPATLALAQKRGGVSGTELIAAVAAGQDIFGRLRTNVGWLKDWNLSTVLAVFAASAASARVLGLDARQTADAMGIASMQCSGIMEMVAGRGSDLRGMYAGFSAKGAVLSAQMAAKGISGIEKMFEGQYGFFNTYFRGQYDRDGLLRGLGQEFLGAGTLYKRWPCVGTAHSHMKAAIDIVVQNDLAPEDIAEIRLHVGDYHQLMCEPMEARVAPATLADAKFSLPFLVAIAITRRGMGVGDFTEAGLRDTAILATGRKMQLVVDPALNWTLDLPPGRVEIVAQDGRSWLVEGQNVPGNAEAPMTWDDIRAKFLDCAAAAVTPVPRDRADAAVDLAQRLDGLADVSELLSGL